jgi:hypothetical protein
MSACPGCQHIQDVTKSKRGGSVVEQTMCGMEKLMLVSKQVVEGSLSRSPLACGNLCSWQKRWVLVAEAPMTLMANQALCCSSVTM